jgi:hypothetical protein
MSAEPPELTKTEPPYVAPRTELEHRLAQLWSEVLGVERVGAHDDFFELGGDSSRSLLLVARAAEAGLDFSPSDLLSGATVAELADAIAVEHKPTPTSHRDGQPTPEEEIRSVTLRPGNQQKAVFVLLSALYDLPKVRALSARLPDASFHVLVPAWSPARPYVGIPALGHRVAEAMRSLLPEGEYRIIGHCGSGLAAYEAASVLRHDNVRIRRLVLLDTDHPHAAGAHRRLAEMLPVDDQEHLDVRAVASKLDWLEELRASPDLGRQELMLHVWAVLRSNLRPLLRFIVDLDPSRWSEELVDHVARDLMTSMHYCVAADSYDPGPYDGGLDLVFGRPDSGCHLEETRAARVLPWARSTAGQVNMSWPDDIHSDILQSQLVADLLNASFDAG